MATRYQLNNGQLVAKIRDSLQRGDYQSVFEQWSNLGPSAVLHYTVARAFQLALAQAPSMIRDKCPWFGEKTFLTVVTINFNNLPGLRKTVDSVISQTAREQIQYIVVDGDSSDGSLEHLSQVADDIDLPLYGKDAGIYDAMNRGLAFANSAYTLFLNSGDCFASSDVVARLRDEVQNSPRRPIAAYGPTLTANGTLWPTKDVSDLWQGMICSHQSIIIDTEFLQSIGFNEKYKIVSDFETIYRASLADEPLLCVKTPISTIEDVGISSDFTARTVERWQVVRSLTNKKVAQKEIDDFYSSLLVRADRKTTASNNERGKDVESESVEERLIFLISMPRSGSTMLQKILDRCPDIGTVGEPWVMLPILSMDDNDLISAQYGQQLCVDAGKEFIQAIGQQDLFRIAKKAYSDTIYSAALQAVGTARFLDKTPRYVHIVDKLIDLYPRAKYIVLLRNPAAIITSYAHTWAGGDYGLVAGNPEFMYDFDHGLQSLGRLAESGVSNIHMIRYEELVANPEREVRAMLDYLELPFSADLVNYGASSNTQVGKYRFGDPKTVYEKNRPDASHADRWLQENKSARNLHLFKRIVQGLSAETVQSLGYSKVEITASIDELEAAKRINLPQLVAKYAPKQNSQRVMLAPKMGKRLGVLITSYNNGGTIISALESVLSQSKAPDVVMVADDGSTDGSQEVLREFLAKERESNVRLVCRKANVGVAANRDLAIRQMDVEFISTLDGDDLYFPGKLEGEWRVLQGREDRVAFGDILICRQDEDELLLNTSAYHMAPRKEVASFVLSRAQPVPRDLTFSKKLYLIAEGFDHGISIYEDWGLKVRLALAAADGGWMHSGCIGTVYDRRAPGLSGKTTIAHAFGELLMIARNVRLLSNYNDAVRGGLNSVIRHLAGNMKERAAAFMKEYPDGEVIPPYIHDSLLFFWQDRKNYTTTDEMAKAIWQLFSPPLAQNKGAQG